MHWAWLTLTNCFTPLPPSHLVMGSGVTIPTQTGFGEKPGSSFFLPVTLFPATGEPSNTCQGDEAVPCKGENCSMWREDTLLKSLPRGKVDPSDDWRGTQFHVTGGHIVEIPATDALYQKGNSCHVVFEKDLERTFKGKREEGECRDLHSIVFVQHLKHNKMFCVL